MTFAGDDAKARHDLEGIDNRNIVRAARFYASVTPLVHGADKKDAAK